MKSLRFIPAAVMALLISITIWSCQKEVSAPLPSASQQLSVYLTDAPVPFDHVYIDIQKVEVKIKLDSCTGTAHHSGNDDNGGNGSDSTGNDDHGGRGNDDHGSGGHGNDDHGTISNGADDNGADDDSCEVWVTVPVNGGVYDLLQFRNGADALIAGGSIPAGEIEKIRVTLGTNNSVVIDSVQYPVSLPAGSVVTIKTGEVEQDDNGNPKLHLDFDLGQSIIRLNGNRFELRPWIRPFHEIKTAKVEGKVLPADARAVITLAGNMDTLVAIPGHDGRFRFRGVRSSSFSLQVNATAGGYADTTISNLTAAPGREISVGTIVLHR